MIHKLKGFLPDNRPASGSLHVTVEFQRRSAESEHDEVEFLYCPAGFFTEQEVDDLREAFNLFDTDGGGSISNAEIWTIMQSLGQKPTAEEVQAMVDDFDEDGNGEIDFEEFLGMMYKKALEVSDDVNLADAFKTFDLAGNGFVSEDEMREILLNLDIELSDQEVLIWIAMCADLITCTQRNIICSFICTDVHEDCSWSLVCARGSGILTLQYGRSTPC